MNVDVRLQQALEFPRMNTLATAELIADVSGLIGQVFVMVGFKPPAAEDLCLLTAKLATDLQECYGGLTLQEVSLCFEYGAKGEYGDFMGINLRTLTGWLKSYRKSERRYLAVVHREREREQIALPPVSKAYKEERGRAFVERIFHQYREGVPLDRLFPAQVYRMLQERGIINDPPEVKWDAMAKAAAKYAPRTGYHLPEEKRQILVKYEAMAICLRSHFDRLIAEGCETLVEGLH